MARRLLLAGLMAGLVALAGCTNVQKGSAAGGVAGGVAGAGIGHRISSVGGAPGALVGLGLGATAGAIAAEHYYGSDDSEEIGAAQESVERLSNELQTKDVQLEEMAVALEKERSQQKALLQAYEKARGDLQTLSANAPANVEVVSDGDTVTFSILSEVLFDSGAAELTKEGKAALKRAGEAIRAEFPDSTVEVRGHTDNVPIRYSPHKSNWELSCARALAVLHYLIESQGFDSQRMTVAGCADTRPVASNATATGRRKNRRAELVVRPEAVQLADVRVVR